jgi:serine/threonine protein kinase
VKIHARLQEQDDKDEQYILQCKQTVDAHEFIYLLFQPVCQGNLYRLLIKTTNYNLTGRTHERRIARYMDQILQALQHCHRLNIVHRDIKPENLLLTDDDRVLLCDFGLSSIDETDNTSLYGTLDYLSPEMLQRKRHSFTVDVWSVGVLTCELLTGKLPFSQGRGDLIEEVKARVVNGNITWPANRYLSNESKHFIERFLCLEPKDRITLDDARRHPFILGSIK